MSIQQKLAPKRLELQGKTYSTWAGTLDTAHAANQSDLVRFLGIETTIVQLPTPENGGRCVVHARAKWRNADGDAVAFDGIGDADPTNTKSHIAAHLIRMAETRAKGRALRDSVNIGEVLEEELGEETPPQRQAPEAQQQPARQQPVPARRTETVHEPTGQPTKTATSAERGDLMNLVQEGLGKDPAMRIKVAADWGCKPEQVQVRLGTKSDAELAAILNELMERAAAGEPPDVPARPSLTMVPRPPSIEALRAEVVAVLAHDAEAAAKLPKTPAEMNEAELSKTLAWLNRRARALSS